MGRKRKKHLFRKEKSATSEVNKEQPERKGYSDIIKSNLKFETYYKTQGIIPEGEWDLFMNVLRENLPASFRITGYKGQAKALLNIIKGKYFDNLLKHEGDDADKCRPFSLPWYPQHLAWQMNLSRVVIRTSENLQHLHNFLISETETGNISRQETVSMIPPILLDVQPHHKVLDMCAAPGSKTAQVIEFLHKEDGKIPGGLVVANDVDNKRCYMLVHQAKRLNSPCFIITNQDASSMPELSIEQDGVIGNLRYDRILCDVPCSGDGTMRKIPDIWQKWNVGNANGLHNLQLRIAKRGLELLALHGRLVYSTCSLNPVEDEAVISALLQMAGDSAELVDVSDALPGLKRNPGISKWKVSTKDMTFCDTFDEVHEKYHTQIRPSMFPPNSEVAEKLHLNRCFRVLPYFQDTGGFFVAVIEKVKEKLPWQSDEGSDSQQQHKFPPRKKQKVFGYKEDPFIFLNENDADWPSIRDFYDLKDFKHTNLLCRCQEKRKRNIYLVSDSVKSIIQNNKEKIKIINTGVRMLCRSENKDATCIFRLTQEGLSSVLPFLGRRKVNILKEDLVLTLTNEYTSNELFSEKVRQQLESIESGCVVLVYIGNEGTDEEFSIEVCAWKGKLTLRCYVAKQERVHYLRMSGEDVTEYEKRDKKRFKIKANVTEEAANLQNDEDNISESIDNSEIEIDAADMTESFDKGSPETTKNGVS